MQTELRAWTVKDSIELYNVGGWGRDFFTINEAGNVSVTPSGPGSVPIDLKELVDDLRSRGLNLPILIRFSDILRTRVEQLFGAFRQAIAENDYRGAFRGVYPIKVNQQRHVVEELMEYGRPYDLGIEAGSKPELLVALALQENPEALILCNGYKDRAFIETALLAQKLGRRVVITMDRMGELDTILAAAAELDLRPVIGVRARLTTKGAGKWVESTGDRSKFGLTTAEIVAAVEKLRAVGMLDCLQLLHFHIGSQITNIRAVKDALRESSRIFVELHALGANMRYLDCGGGLGVDYDGSQTNFHSSVNYTLQEYAADIVSQVAEACNARGVPHPDLVTESGRALVAHHSVLVYNVLATNEILAGHSPEHPGPSEHPVIHQLYETYTGVSRKNFQEAYHDALQIKEEAITAFNLGVLDLQGPGARRGALLGHLREDPEDRPRAALRARRARGAREAADRHLLLQLLAVPVDARPLGGEAALPHHADPPPGPSSRCDAASWPTSPATATARSTEFIDLRDVKGLPRAP